MKPLIVIVGETASGKSEVAIDLAVKLNGEIINADSWAVYREFNLGTAKPSDDDQKRIKHYLIDIADPREGFSAARFKKLATDAMSEIYKKDKVPIIVGGTGLYIDSIVYDYSFLPPSSKLDRKYYDSLSLSELVKMCKKLGYDSKKIDMNNKRRVIRLLENKGAYPKSKPLRKNTLIIGIGLDAVTLEGNIRKRTQTMLDNGLENEVKVLVNKYGWEIEPLKGIGYREFKDFFDDKIDKLELTERINIDTLKLVKKQRTWFKRNKSIQWLYNREIIVEVATTFLNKFN
jgi:tRNA dimethylallyltransferase